MNIILLFVCAILVISPSDLWASSDVTCEIKGPFRKIDNSYADIARQTGGQVFNLQPDELGKIDLAPLLLLNDSKKKSHNGNIDSGGEGGLGDGGSSGASNLLDNERGNAYETYISTFYKHNDSKKLKAEFPVDSTIKKISIKIDSNKKVKIYVKDSFGAVISNSNTKIQQLSSSCIIISKAPKVGDWSIEVDGNGEVEVDIKALSPIDFSGFKWMRSTIGRHGRMLVQEDNPRINNPTFSRSIIYGDEFYDPNLSFLVKDRYGNIFHQVEVEKSYKDEYFLEKSLPSEEEMYIFAKGKDLKGNDFIRKYPFTIKVFK